MILTDEFSRQASMEQDLGIPSALFAAPVREIIELGKSQIGFMNMFAIPLFQGVTDVMPGMEFCVDELDRNKSRWENKIAEEQSRVRLDSVDSRMVDGMFSPRSMSLATPSDAGHQKPGSAISSGRSNADSNLRIKAMLSKSPFAQPKHIPDESAELGHHHSMPDISTNDLLTPDSENPSPSQGSPGSSRRTSRPLQLQLSYATSSALGLLESVTVGDGDAARDSPPPPHLNGIEIQPSLVTDAVLVDSTNITSDMSLGTSEPSSGTKQRTSDTTTESSSAGGGGDWTSQATSATTNKMPLSPSTKGTSILSEADSIEKGDTPTSSSPIPGNDSQPQFTHTSSSPSTNGNGQEADGEIREGDSRGVMETVRGLRKKSSRFRMNFWKRSKSSSPPVPGRERRAALGSDGSEEMLGLK